jgi:DNA-binding FadR family transcriptional regulator
MRSNPPGSPRGPAARRPKLSNVIAEDLLRWIARDRLHPGDRLPNEKTLMEHYQCAKGTVREALRTLEVQGLVKMQTGPNGGAVIQPVPIDAVARQLRTFLHFEELSFEQVYELRHSLEVTLALSVAGRLDGAQLAQLEANIEECAEAMARDDRPAVRHAELAFHDILCESCPNPLLTFMCRFINGLLRDLVEYRSERLEEHNAFGRSNIESHRKLVAAFRNKDADAVSRVMADHIHEAETFMSRLDAAFRSKNMLGG